MNLAQKIEANRRKHARFRRAERVLRAVRQRIFDYEDESPIKLAKAQKVIDRCKRTLAPLWEAQSRNNENRKMQNYMM